MSRKYVIPRFNIQDLLRALYNVNFTDTGSATYCKCPLGPHTDEPPNGDFRIYHHDEGWGGWICHKHGKGTIWDLLEQYHGLPGWEARDDASFDDTILFVCEALDITPELKENAEYDKSDLVRALYRDIREALSPIHFGKENPHWQLGENGTWLYRSFSPMRWLQEGVGMLSSKTIRDLRQKHKLKVWRDAGLAFGQRKDWTDWISQGVILLRRNHNNVVVGIAVRRYEELAGDLGHAKYMKNRDNLVMENSSYLYNYRQAKQSKASSVYTVEGEFDARVLSLHGITNVVTWGSGIPSANQKEMLLTLERSIRVIPDTDLNGAGFKHAVELAHAIPEASFLFLPPGESGNTDADEWVRMYGPVALRQLPSHTSLMVVMTDEERDNQGLWLADTEALVEKYMTYIAAHPTPRDQDDVEYVAQLSGYDEKYLFDYLRSIRNEQILARLLESTSTDTTTIHLKACPDSQ